MTKLFLILLLITKHSFVSCMSCIYGDECPEVIKVLAWKDFSKLSLDKDTLYTAQIKQISLSDPHNETYDNLVYTAVVFENISAMHWLLSKRVRPDSSALEWALAPIVSEHIKLEVVDSLLSHGVSTDIIIKGNQPLDLKADVETWPGKKPLDFTQSLLALHQKNDRKYKLKDNPITLEIQQVANRLERHELRWAWIQAAALVNSGRVEIIEETHK